MNAGGFERPRFFHLKKSVSKNRWKRSSRPLNNERMNTMPPIGEMQRAYLNNDSTYDGIFFLGVRTTGIFCRPSCPARKPLPENVDYFSNVREAVSAGYRPCKRCRPLATNGTEPEWVDHALSLAQES